MLNKFMKKNLYLLLMQFLNFFLSDLFHRHFPTRLYLKTMVLFVDRHRPLLRMLPFAGAATATTSYRRTTGCGARKGGRCRSFEREVEVDLLGQ